MLKYVGTDLLSFMEFTSTKVILPFNPKSETYEAFKITLTPKMAQYILDNHNKDNRKISKSQVHKIFRSIENDNWMLDGQPMSFNKEGNLTEFQHRLHAMIKCPPNREFDVIVVTGVDSDCFTKTATNRPRKPIDEIQRKYNRAQSEEVSVLGDVLKRRRGKRLEMQNAIYEYERWFKNISNSICIGGNYENVTNKFCYQKKTVRSWIVLCERYGYIEECKTFLEYLDAHLDPDSDCDVTISNQFVDFWNENAVDLSNEKRMDFLYSMFCLAIDLISDRDDGMVEFDFRPNQLEHHEMIKKGVYKKFLA